jgi:hypothetical protein
MTFADGAEAETGHQGAFHNRPMVDRRQIAKVRPGWLHCWNRAPTCTGNEAPSRLERRRAMGTEFERASFGFKPAHAALAMLGLAHGGVWQPAVGSKYVGGTGRERDRNGTANSSIYLFESLLARFCLFRPDSRDSSHLWGRCLATDMRRD